VNASTLRPPASRRPGATVAARLALTLGLLILSACSPCGNRGVCPMTDRGFAEAFVEIVTKPEFAKPDQSRDVLNKWVTQEIRVYSCCELDADQRGDIDDAMATIDDITGIRFRAVDSMTPELPEMMLFYAAADDLRLILDKLRGPSDRAGVEYKWFLSYDDFIDFALDESDAPCFAMTFNDADRNTIHSMVFIADRLPREDFRECVFEEMVQSMGPHNDIQWGVDSMFDDTSDRIEPSPFDKLVLRIIYDDRLSSGMRPDFLKDLLPALVRKHCPGFACLDEPES